MFTFKFWKLSRIVGSRVRIWSSGSYIEKSQNVSCKIEHHDHQHLTWNLQTQWAQQPVTQHLTWNLHEHSGLSSLLHHQHLTWNLQTQWAQQPVTQHLTWNLHEHSGLSSLLHHQHLTWNLHEHSGLSSLLL